MTVRAIAILAASIAAVAAVSACSNDAPAKPTAKSVCEKIVAGGIGANCRSAETKGLTVGAISKYEFDLPSVPGHTGQVLEFDESAIYDKTVQSFADLESIAGPHRYGNRTALIFVQANEGLPAELGAALKKIVDGLAAGSEPVSRPSTSIAVSGTTTAPADAPAPASASTEPTVVECLDGTPGPARWSDGSTRFSQYCYDTRGGAESDAAERNAGLSPTSRPMSSGEIQMQWLCQQKNPNVTPEQCAASGFPYGG